MSNDKTSNWVTAFFNVIIFGIIGLLLGTYIGCAIGVIIGLLFAILSGVERNFNMLNEKNKS
ncbi:hypothetical protein [Clostridium sp.]|jgi:uncharacterized membrane protein|uniref:hypothetical protein n=1 Tax=Clostridium sp. TaxID=1506 RepID=UPI003EED30AC